MTRLIDFEFAPIDIDLLVHPKAIAAGMEAMGLWLWGNAWCQRTNSSGLIPRHVIAGAWGATKASADKLARRLVASGLWLENESGWEVWNYEKKNPVAILRDRRRAADRVRQAEKRARDKERDVTTDVTRDSGVSHTVASVSGSTSGSGSDLGGGAGGTPPDWARRVADTVAMGIGVRPDLGAVWLAYTGKRGDAGRNPTPGDFQAYLSSWSNREKREPKSKHNAPRQGLGSAASAPWMNGGNNFNFEDPEMTPPDDGPRDEHGERIPDQTPRKGGGSLADILATFEAHGAERQRADEEHRASCTAEVCARCGKAKCSACGTPGRVYGGRCQPCDDRHSRGLMRDRVLASVPKRFRWVIATPDKLRERVKPAGIIGAAVKWATELGLFPPSLVLHGPTGAGKSSLAVALFASWGELPMHPDAMFASAFDVAMAPGAHPLGQGLAPLLERAYSASLLVLDDVGAEPPRLSEVIHGVMHKRYDANLPTWITTGLDEADIAKRYDGGVARRMFEEAKLVKLGEDGAR